MYAIPAQIVKRDGNVSRVVFQYVKDSETGVFYHRCMRSQHPDAFVQSFFNRKIWNEVDFPPLGASAQHSKKPGLKLQFEEVRFLYDPEFGSVTFTEDGDEITLFAMDDRNHGKTNRHSKSND